MSTQRPAVAVRPRTVTAAFILLYALAALFVVVAVTTLAPEHLVSVLIYCVSAAVFGVLGLHVSEGRARARIATWVAASLGITTFGLLAALAPTGTALVLPLLVIVALLAVAVLLASSSAHDFFR